MNDDEGMVGYLTYTDWDRFRRAWSTAHEHLPWWWIAGQIRGGDTDELRSRSSESPIGLPATYLTADEITSYMHELNAWPELEDAAHDNYGHYVLQQFTAAVETAAAKWPLSDRTHKVKFFRCQACNQQSLRYYPPNGKLRPDAPTVDVNVRGVGRVRMLDVVVRCSDKACNAVMDSAMFERATVMIAYEQEMRSGKRRVDSDSAGTGADRQEQVDGLPVVA